MAISNCLFSPTSENPRGFSVWCVLAKLSANPRNYSQPKPLCLMQKTRVRFTLFNQTRVIICYFLTNTRPKNKKFKGIDMYF